MRPQIKRIKRHVLDIRIGFKIGRRSMDWALRTGAQDEIIENLQEMEDEGEIYERIEDLWPDYPSKDDFFFNEDEY